ncbi:FAD-binding oxidoreductase [Komagataeibacter sp. FNDCF1]|uniref:FAD-binding oxidoreductase n=1 Tax=Komagataeibacter sp. FNDCF1 TaxID=2878681 RepID=UPI001E4749C9|nr:FAD-linked oxidase C-terminal domain-containing protein [Komagataeibacter sp. FNDCF1]MCE2563450.1 FAD-binding protein [Komagataeibacter sp. FNDCF1]
MAPSPVQQVLAALAPMLGERISRNDSIRTQHSHGEGWMRASLPEAVLFAHTTQEVSAILARCHAHRVPVVPFGAGTSLEGHVTPPPGAVSINLSHMTRILQVNPDDLDCRVEAGVTRQALNAQLRDMGLFFPVDPGGEATIGGMCATRASGTAAVRYGTMRENVMGLRAVMADGRIVDTGGRVRKSATGYDLTGLLVGSEGTLGIITEIQLRLHGIPETMAAAVCQFPTLGDAVRTAVAIMQMGIPIGRLELMDDVQMDACIQYSRLEGYRKLTTLFFEFQGSPASVREQVQIVEELAGDNGGLGFAWSESQEERTRLWKARHAAYWAGLAYRPGCQPLATDAIVPISALTELMIGVKEDIRRSGLCAPIVGHVGDGNFHTLILVPPEDGAYARALDLDRRIVRRALALGGSCSGEHGIGSGKMEFMQAEHGAPALDVMRAIRHALDPRNILNPGKLLPPVLD